MNGRRADWLAGMDWPALLEMPLTDVKSSMQISSPVKYQELMFSLRASKRSAREGG